MILHVPSHHLHSIGQLIPCPCLQCLFWRWIMPPRTSQFESYQNPSFFHVGFYLNNCGSKRSGYIGTSVVALFARLFGFLSMLPISHPSSCPNETFFTTFWGSLWMHIFIHLSLLIAAPWSHPKCFHFQGMLYKGWTHSRARKENMDKGRQMEWT